MNTPAGKYLRQGIWCCAIPLLLIPAAFVLLAAITGQFPLTGMAILNSFWYVFWVALIAVTGAWLIIVLPAMLFIPPNSPIWRLWPAVTAGMGCGLLALFIVCGFQFPDFRMIGTKESFFLVGPWIATGVAAGYLAHRKMTPMTLST